MLAPEVEDEPATSVPPPVASVAPPAPAPEVVPTPVIATSVPPPSPAPAQPEAPEPAQASRNHWLTAVCLLALIALVVALTGRRPCGCAEKTR